MKLSVFIFLLFAVFISEGYKILVVFPLPVRSLNLLGEGIVKHLLAADHEVTYMSAFPIKHKPEKNFRQIDVSQNVDYFSGDQNTLNLTTLMAGRTVVDDIQALQEMALTIATLTFENENVQNLLKDTREHFDAVLVDLYETEIYSGLAALYDCPMIWAYSMGAHWNVLRLIDEPTNAAYSADCLSANVPPFNFIQRIEELWAQIKWNGIKRFITTPKEEAAYEKIFRPLLALRGKATLPNYQELIYNASLVLSNEYYSFGNIPSTPQNFKFIAGQHIDNDTPPLPKDLQSLMDDAKHGVIYFSLGSAWQSKDMPDWITKSLLEVFGKLKQTVIWKYEADLTDLPKNVYIMPWAPQHSILAHPNCLFFISHGGLLSSTEAVHFGVPIIGVPIFLDQFINVNKAIARGYAIKAELSFNLPENLKTAISTMLSDDRYKKTVKKLSLVYHDRVVSPGTELVHWVEHVVRTRGAPHLRSPALMVPWYQKMYLDLVALIIVSLIILKQLIFGLFRSSKRSTKDKKNN